MPCSCNKSGGLTISCCMVTQRENPAKNLIVSIRSSLEVNGGGSAEVSMSKGRDYTVYSILSNIYPIILKITSSYE